MKRDLDVDYENARLKRQQLEDEIGLSEALPSEKANMQHTLSKLWISVQNIRDAANREVTKSLRNAPGGGGAS